MVIHPAARHKENPFFRLSRSTQDYRHNTCLDLINKGVAVLSLSGLAILAGGFDGSLMSLVNGINDVSWKMAMEEIRLPTIVMDPLLILTAATGAAILVNDRFQTLLRTWDTVSREVRDSWKEYVLKRVKSTEESEDSNSNLWLEELHNAGVVIVPLGATLNAIEQLMISNDRDFAMRTTDFAGILVCERKYFREVERTLYELLKNGSGKTFSIFNDGNIGDPITAPPALLTVQDDGSAFAVWADQEGVPNVAVEYSQTGTPRIASAFSSHEYESISPAQLPPLREAIDKLNLSVTKSKEDIKRLLRTTRYYKDTHRVKPLRDGSFVILDERTRRVDNPYGPAVITANGRTLFYKHGSIRTKPWKEIHKHMDNNVESVEEHIRAYKSLYTM